jgi:hypothetical protein
VTVPLGQGLFINQRMTCLKENANAIELWQRKLQAITVLYDASLVWHILMEENFTKCNYMKNIMKNANSSKELTLIKQGDKTSN